MHDIDWSCPADLEPYAKAHKLEIKENDTIIHAVCGNYVLSAVSVAVEHCFAGKKARSEYVKKPILQKIKAENNSYKESNEDVAVYEMKLRAKALERQDFRKAQCKKDMEEKIKEFIRKRFPTDCKWLNGNCYFFAVILQATFGGDIYYDVINGHFLLQCEGGLYDWTGKVENCGLLVKWNDFEQYDRIQKQRIIRDCIK